MLHLVFDSNALITCCQAGSQHRPAIEDLLAVSTLSIPTAVEQEVLAAHTRYSDASLVSRLITMGRIQVSPANLPADSVLEGYRLGSGEKECVAFCLDHAGQVDFWVTDDRLAYVVGRRCGIPALLFLDLVIELVQRELWDLELATKIVQSVQHRFSGGFVPHTLSILRSGDRKCLS
ncbi:MAG: hypothetical protein QG637_1305 [Chloroflexota bacterium]|nr:hypothetical protein [Chloroflexota bacterium]